MKLYVCDIYDETKGCESCYRHEICHGSFIRDNGHDPYTHTSPLTLEQLKERIGKKVWVQSPGVTEYGRLAIVEDVDIEKKILWLLNDFTCHDYGVVWEAYEHEEVHSEWKRIAENCRWGLSSKPT